MPNVMHDIGRLVHATWMGPAGRLIWASLATLVGFVVGFILLSRPKSERPVTWAQAMLGAVAIFAMFLLCYGIVPSEWITFSDKYLQWSTDKFVWRSSQSMLGLPFNWPFSFNKQNIRDVIAAGIYIVFFGANLFLFVKWQKRPTAAETTARGDEGTEAGTSRFGRPLRRFRRPVTTEA